MPFELLKGVGEDCAYNPMLHGYSQREIKDTIRRMETLLEDLDKLVSRKEKEKKRLQGVLPIADWVGKNVNKERQQEAYDHACWAAMDKVGIELELPVVQEALQHAPEETPPLQHEDYYKRCQNLQERRGEYWRINPGFLDFHPFSIQGAEGLGLRTPEQEKYWPTHQVPWQQGAPSPCPLSPPTPPPLPPPYQQPQPWRPPTHATCRRDGSFLEPEYPTPEAASTPPSCLNQGFLDDSGSMFTPPTEEGGACDKDLEELACIMDEVQEMVEDIVRMKSAVECPAEGQEPDCPDQPGVQECPDEPGYEPESCPEEPEYEPEPCPPCPPCPSCPPCPRCSPRPEEPEYEPESCPTCPESEPCPPCPDQPVYRPEPCPPCPELEPCPEQPCHEPEVCPPSGCILPDSHDHLITQREFDSVARDDFLGPFEHPLSPGGGPAWSGAPVSPVSPAGSGDWGLLDERTLAQGFSPQQYSADEMENMMGDAVQCANQAGIEDELLDPQQFQQCFSPEVLDEATIQRLLHDPRERELIISPDTQQGLQILADEGTDQAAAGHGCMREEQWNERVGGWREQEEKWREEQQWRGQSAQARQMDAQSLFGVHSRGLHIPCSTPPPPAPTYVPETLPWGQSPVDLTTISPPPMRTPVPSSTKGKGKRLVRPKPNLGPRPMPSKEDMLPSRLLYPDTKGGPTVDYPDRPTTSQCIYNTKQRRYDYLQRSPEFGTWWQKEAYIGHHRNRYEQRLIPGPGVVPPKPAPPPPQPPPECGPEPEHLSVYIPESVEESPNTFRKSLNEAMCRFEQKMERVKQRMGPILKHCSRSPWVEKEYAGEGPSQASRRKEDKIRGEVQTRKKWDSFMLGKYGCVPSPDKLRPGKMRGLRTRTASTYRPREEVWPYSMPYPQKTKAPVKTPEDEGPMHGPWLPWVAGSNRPPPRTAAGRISSPYSASPKPVFRQPAETRCGPSPPKTKARQQPTQVQYGSARAPPKTAASYKYQATPPGRPNLDRPIQRRRIVPSTPEMLYGSARAPPKTASSRQWQNPPFPRPQQPPCPLPQHPPHPQPQHPPHLQPQHQPCPRPQQPPCPRPQPLLYPQPQQHPYPQPQHSPHPQPQHPPCPRPQPPLYPQPQQHPYPQPQPPPC